MDLDDLEEFIKLMDTKKGSIDLLIRKNKNSSYVKAGYFRITEFRGNKSVEYVHLNKNLKAQYTCKFMQESFDGLTEIIEVNGSVLLRDNDYLIIQKPGMKSSNDDLVIPFAST